MARWLTALGVMALVSLAAIIALRFNQPHAAEALANRGRAQRYEKLWAAPDFAFANQHGQTVSRGSLQGRVWVANFIFTQCRTICPLLTSKMMQLRRKLANVDVTYVSFSVDPAVDTVPVLAAYAKRWAPDATNWELLSTSEKTLPLLTAGFHVTAQPNAEAVDQVIHSSVFLLVDQNGDVRGVFDSEHRDDFAALEAGVRQLAGAAAAPPPESTDPQALYHELGCANCHERPELAPALGGLKGLRREFDTGLGATFDAAYVKESLVSPDLKRVKGYPLHMPTYEGVVSDRGLDALTAWVLALPAPAAPAPGDTVEVDPVCHMQVRVTADAPSFGYKSGPEAPGEAHTYHFCSNHCRDRFAANPASFLQNH